MGAEARRKIPSRRIIYIPIAHTDADMGSLSGAVRRISLEKLGRFGRKRKDELIDRIWSEIDREIERLSLPWDRVRIYQDGLPVSGRESEIVTELAKRGSRNHKLILGLTEKGGTLMGTESVDLLLEEYELAKRLMSSKRAGANTTRDKLKSDSLLKRRDQFIANRINDTLREGETAIVFLGMLHSLEPWLAKDIEVVHPM